MSYVTLRDGEDGEQLLKRFQTSMQRSGILRELRNRRFFRSKGEQARLDKQRSLSAASVLPVPQAITEATLSWSSRPFRMALSASA